MQDGIQQRIVDVNLAVVADEAQFPKLVHEKADPGAGCPDHLRERLLADLDVDRLRNAFLAEVGEKQQKPFKPALAGIEELIDQVFFHTTAAGQEIGYEKRRADEAAYRLPYTSVVEVGELTGHNQGLCCHLAVEAGGSQRLDTIGQLAASSLATIRPRRWPPSL